MDSSDPRWIGAWWLGLVFSCFGSLTVAALIACFPRELPSKVLSLFVGVLTAEPERSGLTDTLYMIVNVAQLTSPSQSNVQDSRPLYV